MSEHMKKPRINKTLVKKQLMDSLSLFKTLYANSADNDDRAFIQTIKKEVNALLEDTTVPADEIFQPLIHQQTKAGALLRGVRIREGLSQVAFAKRIKTSQANLSSMENGKRPIGKQKAKLIAEKFGVDYRYFL